MDGHGRGVHLRAARRRTTRTFKNLVSGLVAEVQATGEFSFNLEYDFDTHLKGESAPDTYTYTLSEKKGDPADGLIYDETVYTITVKLTDDGDRQNHAERNRSAGTELREHEQRVGGSTSTTAPWAASR